MTTPERNLSFRAVIAAIFIVLLCVTSGTAQAGDDAARENKRIVLDFYAMLFEKHLVKDAFAMFVSEIYIQHNPNLPDGIEPDIKFLTERFRDYPEAANEVKRAVAEGDLVVLHVHSRLGPKDRGRAIVDIFRVTNGKIVEHWDVIQPVPEKAANNNTMF